MEGEKVRYDRAVNLRPYMARCGDLLCVAKMTLKHDMHLIIRDEICVR